VIGAGVAGAVVVEPPTEVGAVLPRAVVVVLPRSVFVLLLRAAGVEQPVASRAKLTKTANMQLIRNLFGILSLSGPIRRGCIP
jgi:hypothetical protein